MQTYMCSSWPRNDGNQATHTEDYPTLDEGDASLFGSCLLLGGSNTVASNTSETLLHGGVCAARCVVGLECSIC